jgi:hypothetical protein
MKFLKSVVTGLFAMVAFAGLQAQTLDEVIGKHLDAMGGKDKLLLLNSVVMDASMTMQGAEIIVKMTQLHNKGQRIDITAMGMAGYMIQTATEGWRFLPFQGQAKPEATPAETVKELVDGLDIQSPFLNYKEKGHQVELVGKEDVEGTEAFKIKLKMKSGLEQTIFLDPTTYYIIKAVTKSKATGQEQEQAQTFSNYKKLDSGYVFPFAMTGFGPAELIITKIQVNPPVDEKLFKVSEAATGK